LPRIPRRWSTEVDGIRWLPRMIDKARMSMEGRLGAYLLGQSPVDRALLKRLGMDTQTFTDLVRDEDEDAGVLAALRAYGFDEERVRRWSDLFTIRYRGYIPLWDLDEGYVRPNAVQAVALGVLRLFEVPVIALIRKIFRAP
jgi:hypothetical protein